MKPLAPLFACLLVLAIPLTADAGPRFGVEAGGSWVWNEFGVESNDNIADLEPRLEFNAAATVHFYITPSWGLTTGLRYSRLGHDAEVTETTLITRQQYLGIPVLARLSFGGDLEPFLFGGAEAAWLIQATYENPVGEREITDSMKRYNVTAVVGAGIEVGVGGHGLEIAARYGYGLVDIANHEEPAICDTKIKTRELALTVGFRL